MQNDFLQRSIFPECFISFLRKISMEAKTKEKFSELTVSIQKSDICCVHTVSLYLIQRKYSTEKTKFSPRKRKSPENLGKEVFGKRIIRLRW